MATSAASAMMLTPVFEESAWSASLSDCSGRETGMRRPGAALAAWVLATSATAAAPWHITIKIRFIEPLPSPLQMRRFDGETLARGFTRQLF